MAVAVIVLAGLAETLISLVAFLLVWGLLAVRLSLIGLYVTADSVRRRGVLATRTVPWSSVSEVSATQIAMKDGTSWSLASIPADAVARLQAASQGRVQDSADE
ncbi:PH domain-containing protein [Kibdelosporangium aridum]|uniref:PH domain-containing protein n=1 Tax=Kibdelosporangium aridum TaxID=2030 RepID=UPI00163C8975|nr:PH domain-containing protein [Kibdelosporangium aridum]